MLPIPISYIHYYYIYKFLIYCNLCTSFLFLNVYHNRYNSQFFAVHTSYVIHDTAKGIKGACSFWTNWWVLDESWWIRFPVLFFFAKHFPFLVVLTVGFFEDSASCGSCNAAPWWPWRTIRAAGMGLILSIHNGSAMFCFLFTTSYFHIWVPLCWLEHCILELGLGRLKLMFVCAPGKQSE